MTEALIQLYLIDVKGRSHFLQEELIIVDGEQCFFEIPDIFCTAGAFRATVHSRTKVPHSNDAHATQNYPQICHG